MKDVFNTAREQEKSCLCLLVHFAFKLISLFLSKKIYQKYCMKNKKIVHHFHSFCVLHGLLQILHSNLKGYDNFNVMYVCMYVKVHV